MKNSWECWLRTEECCQEWSIVRWFGIFEGWQVCFVSSWSVCRAGLSLVSCWQILCSDWLATADIVSGDSSSWSPHAFSRLTTDSKWFFISLIKQPSLQHLCHILLIHKSHWSWSLIVFVQNDLFCRHIVRNYFKQAPVTHSLLDGVIVLVKYFASCSK